MTIAERIRASLGVKVGTITVLVLLLLIPAGMTRNLVRERQYTRNEAVAEVSSKWGNAQALAGPVLTVPFYRMHKNSEGKFYRTEHLAYFLPEVLKTDGLVTPEVRYRGIYEVVLYRSAMKLTGSFDLKALDQYGINRDRVHWDRVTVSMGISDLRGVQDNIQFHWNGEPLPIEPGMDNGGLLNRGVSVRPDLKKWDSQYTFSMALDLNGSGSLMFVPFGKKTSVQMSSPWASPSFTGEFLPKEREITEEGFSALWNVQYLNRQYPQHWIDTKMDFESSAFGVELLYPADGYQKTMRTAKYAILFIGLAFLAFFLIEVLGGLRIHPVQYLLVGVSLVVFYVLLLSLSEHIGFALAYVAASLALVGVVSGYTASILGSARFGALMAGVMSVLYGFMFVVLQLEDYALLFGSVGLFLVVALTMYMTRKIDWYAIGGSFDASSSAPSTTDV